MEGVEETKNGCEETMKMLEVKKRRKPLWERGSNLLIPPHPTTQSPSIRSTITSCPCKVNACYTLTLE